MANKIIHKHSSVITDGIPKIPTSEQLEYGEIAVNYADGGETISLKNASNEIVEFKSKDYFENIIKDNEYVVATSLNDLNTRINDIDSAIEEKFDEVYKEIEDDEYTISLALNDLNVRLEEKSEEIELVKTTIGNEATSRETAIQEVYDVMKKNEHRIALTFNDLNTRIKNLTSELTTINGRLDEVVKELEDYDLIVSSALTDLDSRFKKMEDILNQNITVLSLGENS